VSTSLLMAKTPCLSHGDAMDGSPRSSPADNRPHVAVQVGSYLFPGIESSLDAIQAKGPVQAPQDCKLFSGNAGNHRNDMIVMSCHCGLYQKLNLSLVLRTWSGSEALMVCLGSIREY